MVKKTDAGSIHYFQRERHFEHAGSTQESMSDNVHSPWLLTYSQMSPNLFLYLNFDSYRYSSPAALAAAKTIRSIEDSIALSKLQFKN